MGWVSWCLFFIAASTSKFRASAAASATRPPSCRISGTYGGGIEKLSAGMQASLAELQAGGTGISDGEACGTFDWIVDFPDFAHMVSVRRDCIMAVRLTRPETHWLSHRIQAGPVDD